MRKNTPASTAREVVGRVFARLQKEKRPSKEEIESLWKEVAGEGPFRHSKPSSLRKKVLTVRVDSPAWMQELDLKKRKIFKGLKRALGKDRISEIRFRIGEI